MKGLLLKDWYQIKSNMKTMYFTVLAVLVIWTLSASGASTFAMNYAAIFLGILPVSLLAYDHSSGWTEYGLTLPMSRKIQVAEKYLIGVSYRGDLCSGLRWAERRVMRRDRSAGKTASRCPG